MRCIGVDLHSNSFTCNFYEKEQRSKMVTYTIDAEKGLDEKFLTQLKKEDYVTVEASTNSFAFYDAIKKSVQEVIIINPLQFQLINQTDKKTDKVDARKLSEMSHYHISTGRKFLSEVYVPDENVRKLRSYYTTYDGIKRMIRVTKNRIHSLLKQNLKPYNQQLIFREGKKEEILKLEIGIEYKEQIKMLYETVEHLERQAESIKAKIMYLGRIYREEIEIMTSVGGISVFTALGLKADYGDIERFKNGKHFSSYLRAVPKVDSSNENVRIGHTKKAGRKLSLGLMIQSLNHFIKMNPHMTEFYDKKIVGKSKGIVRMAIARKMLVILYYMLKKKENYNYVDEIMHDKKMKEYDRFLRYYENKKEEEKNP